MLALSFMETGMLSYQHHRNESNVYKDLEDYKSLSYMDGMYGNGWLWTGPGFLNPKGFP